MNTMNPSRSKPSTSSKRWVNRLGLGCFSLLLGLPLLYYGYCWGVWGRSSLLLQYLFQCGCPVASNEARYPDEVDVVVPACRYVSSILSPSGRLLYVQEKISGHSSTYLLNLQTNEKTLFALPEGSNYFLTDDLMFHSFYGDDEYILDIATGKQYPIQRFASLRSDAYINGELNLSILAEELQDAKNVFLIDDDNIVALATNFHSYPERSFSILRGDIPGREANRTENFLRQNKIIFYHVPDGFPDEALSPDGRFLARHDGIYLVETNQRIVEGYSASGFYRSYSGKYFSVRGWIYDGGGSLYSPFFSPCLIETNFFIFEYPGCFIQVSQPLLKLNLPDEYLLPAETP